jgi:predicted MFS family arabinose efflux permease
MFVNVPIGLAVLFAGRLVLVETPRRHGCFDLAGAVTSTLGMTGIVLGLVEAGTQGWGSADTLGPLCGGAVLLGLFGHVERRAAEPILPLRLLAHRTRAAANAARGLVYAGMYGMFFFLSQFLQDVERYSPLRAGVAFLPLPMSVFLSSQLTSRVLVRRLSSRTLIMLGISSSVVGLALATGIHAGISYGELVISLILLGVGTGMSFVSLTSVSLTDVASEDAGAASGLVNVSQQIGGALGLAVLVTVFGALTHHVQVGGGAGASAAAGAVFIHGLRDAFGVGALFGLSALALVAGFIGQRRVQEEQAADVAIPRLLEAVEDSAA